MKSNEEMGMTMIPTMRSAIARLMMNMLDTVCSLFSVLEANIDQFQRKYLIKVISEFES